MSLSPKLAPILRDAVGSICFLNGKLIPVEALQKLASSADTSVTKETSSSCDPKIVYEVVRWRNNKPGWCDGHAMRMVQSLEKFDYHKNFTADAAKNFFPQAFRGAITAVAERNNIIEQNVKIVVWRQEEKLINQEQENDENDVTKIPQLEIGKNPAAEHPPSKDHLPEDFNWTAFLIKSFYPPEEWYYTDEKDNNQNNTKATEEEEGENTKKQNTNGGVSVAIMTAERHNPHSKVPMPELRSRAHKIQKDFDCFECLLKRPNDGVITEGSRSNFILVMKKEKKEEESNNNNNNKPDSSSSTGNDHELFDGYEIVEARDEDVLMGITRHAIDKICEVQKIPLTKRDITEEDIKNAEGLALSGTSLGCLPIKNLVTFEDGDENKKVTKKVIGNGKIPPILKELQTQYAAYRDGEKTF